MIKEAEKSIIEKLEADISGVSIESFPAKVQEYLKSFIHPTGAVLINYAGSKYTNPDNLNSNAQIRTVEFDIYVVLKNIKNNQGVYITLESVKESLTGYEPEGCMRMIPVSDDFVQEENGIWVYVIKFSAIAPTE